MGTRLRVGLIGQEMGFSLLRVDLGADEATIRTEKLGPVGAGTAEDVGISVSAFLHDR